MSLGRLLLLGSLAAAAALGPKKLASLAPSGALPALQAPAALTELAGLAAKAREAGVSVGADGTPQAVPLDLRRMAAEAAEHPEKYSDDERQMLAELKDVADSQALRAPVVEELLKTHRARAEQVGGWAASVKSGYELTAARYGSLRSRLLPLLWALPGVFVALAVAGVFLSSFSLTRGAAGLAYGISRIWLRALAWGFLGLALAVRVNAWEALPMELVAPPVAGLLAASFLLKLIDMNYPVWNSAVKGLLSPLGSAALTTALQALRQ